jgi:hypothetical protein
MISESEEARASPRANLFTASDVAAILCERGWLHHETCDVAGWVTQAAALLGPQAADREALASLLALVFVYDARALLATRECQEVLARLGAREVIRALATEVLNGGPVDSSRLKEIVTALKATLPYRTREIFLPLRVSLAGRAGEGELDRVILLLDRAARIEGLAPVKAVRTRILEFCSAMD